MPQVSVVIPVHNRETLIGRAIDSVLRQTFIDFELLVVDDGSTDGTVARVLAQTGDPRLRLLRHAANRGAAAARNTAIMAARGEFIAFLDSDDEWLADKLERQIACLAAAPPEMLVCCSGYWMVRERSREVAARIPKARGSWREALWDGCTLSPGSTAFIRRRAFDLHGLFDERLRRLEDWDWLLRYAREHDLTVIAEPLARIHIAERMRSEAVHEAVTLMRAKHGAVMRRLGLWPAARFRAALLMEEAVTSFYAGRYPRAVFYLMGSLATCPRKPAGFFGRIAARALRLLRRGDRVPATSGRLYRKTPER